MKIIYGEQKIEEETAVIIGKFDGVHIGHRKLLEVIKKAGERGLRTSVFTFNPSPARYFGYSDGRNILSINEKYNVLERLGVDYVYELKLDENTSILEPEVFIRDYLLGRMNAKLIAAGPDVSFGNKGRGNYDLLRRMGEEYGYETRLVDKVSFEHEIVSSTLIRQYIEGGNVEKAANMLEMPYFIRGTIIHGMNMGHSIGFPTANLLIPEDKVIPRFGVYRTEVAVDSKEYAGITNVGNKPTVSGVREAGIETYILGFEGNIYEKEAKVSFCEFIRPEIKFDSLEALKQRINEDVEFVKNGMW